MPDTDGAASADPAPNGTVQGAPDDEAGPTEWVVGSVVGVGPWAESHPGEPADDPRYDPELLVGGDRRNVVDRYRYWRREAIVADIDARRHPLHVGIENLGYDYNIGTVVRTANAFAVAAVHIVGRRRWNRRGAMVTDRYQHLHHHPEVSDLVAFASDAGLSIIGVDNTPGSVPLETVALPRDALLLFGSESEGLSPAALDAAAMTVSIAQFGSTRSINAGVAAGIAMHAWIRQHADLDRAW
ncbi:MAG: RNA methyltransferase [Nakamurella sp.]